MKIRILPLLLPAFLATPALAQPQTLQQALVQAYQTNPALQAERAKLRAVDEQVSQALSGYRPSIDATVQGGKAYDSIKGSTTGDSSLTPHSGNIQVTQPLFRGFRTSAGVDEAEAVVMAQRAILHDAEQNLFLDASTAYLDVVEDQAVLDLQKNNEEVLRKQLEATRDRFSVGDVTQTDVSQAESRQQSATASRIQAEGELANRRATYARLIGDVPAELEQPNLILDDPKSMDDAIRQAENNSPVVVNATYNHTAAKADITAVRGSLLPELSLVGNASRAWEQSSGLTNREDSASILARLTVPLYRAGADYSRTRAAQQVATQRRLELEDARHKAREGATSAWQSLMTARAAIESRKAAVDANELALNGVREESNVGTRTTLDVLNAEQELLDAKVNLVRAQHDEAVAVLKTKASVGQLTADALKLSVAVYDPKKNYNAVRNKWAGFGSDSE